MVHSTAYGLLDQGRRIQLCGQFVWGLLTVFLGFLIVMRHLITLKFCSLLEQNKIFRDHRVLKCVVKVFMYPGSVIS